MSDTQYAAVAADLAALRAVVRALARTQVRRSHVALDDMLDYLQAEAARLAVATPEPKADPKASAAALEDWIDALKAEAALWDVEPAYAGGRRIHFLD